MKKLFCVSLLVLSLSSLSACGGRLPSKARTARLAEKHFKKYAKKYPESPFAQDGVHGVDVKDIEELQKYFVTAFISVKLKTGSEVPVIMTLLKKTQGWQMNGWEQAYGGPAEAPALSPENPPAEASSDTSPETAE